MEEKNNILIGEISEKCPIYINSKLADNVEKIIVSVKEDLVINDYSFIVGKDLYKKNNVVILAMNGTVLRYSSVTKKYCKTRRGNPKGFHSIKSRNFNNITDKEGNSVDFKSHGVVFNYYEVVDYIKHIYKISIPIEIEDIIGFLTAREINLSNYEKKENKFMAFIKKVFNRK